MELAIIGSDIQVSASVLHFIFLRKWFELQNFPTKVVLLFVNKRTTYRQGAVPQLLVQGESYGGYKDPCDLRSKQWHSDDCLSPSKPMRMFFPLVGTPWSFALLASVVYHKCQSTSLCADTVSDPCWGWGGASSLDSREALRKTIQQWSGTTSLSRASKNSNTTLWENSGFWIICVGASHSSLYVTTM